MKPNSHRILFATALVAASMLASSCTKRTVLSERPGAVTIAGREDDSKEMRKKFTDRGYKIDEQGNIVAEKNNLFAGTESRLGKDKTGINNKKARIGGRDFKNETYKTPEYLKQKGYNGGKKSAREGGLFSRETKSVARESGDTMAIKEAGFAKKINPFGSKTSRENRSVFATSNNREGTRAVKTSPRADGIERKAGFLDSGAQMSVDDVKRMLNPGGYANARGL